MCLCVTAAVVFEEVSQSSPSLTFSLKNKLKSSYRPFIPLRNLWSRRDILLGPQKQACVHEQILHVFGPAEGVVCFLLSLSLFLFMRSQASCAHEFPL